MKTRSTYSRFLINGAWVGLLFPMYYVGIVNLKQLMPNLQWMVIVALIVLASGGLAFFKVRWVRAISIIIIVSVSISLPFSHKNSKPENILDFQTLVTGVSVFCNDVKLGVTPFRISETELNSKVKPWPTPPPQPRIEWNGNVAPMDRYNWATYFYVPYNPFLSIS